MKKKIFNNGRRSFLLGLGGFGTANLLSNCQYSATKLPKANKNFVYSTESTRESTEEDGETLCQIADSKGILYGGFTQRSAQELAQDLKFQNVFNREYALIVVGFYGATVGPFDNENGNNIDTGSQSIPKGLAPGGASRTGALFPDGEAGSLLNYNFQETDAFADFAAKNNKIFRAHPLIWNEYNSPWLIEKFKAPDTTRAEIDKIFVNHIYTLAKRYAGNVHSWDVVNEGIYVEDGRSDNLKDTTISGIRGEKYPAWLNFLGPNYIERAFHIAAEADPNAILVYNDNGLTYSDSWGTSYDEKRRTAVLKLLERLIARGTPVGALGIQSHLEGHRNQEFDGNKFRKFLSDVADMGLKIIISELDVIDYKLPQDIAIRDRHVAEAYYQYLSVVLDEPAVTTVVNWGLSDRHTWISDFAPRDDGADVRPLLLDKQYLRKPAWQAVALALKEAPTR